jgi:Sec-independent protein secretion pathway component TatC
MMIELFPLLLLFEFSLVLSRAFGEPGPIDEE